MILKYWKQRQLANVYAIEFSGSCISFDGTSIKMHSKIFEWSNVSRSIKMHKMH